jgi:branched-chain amino acid transport system permease protein
MLSYLLAGLAFGSVYAIASASLVVTYISTGMINFAFGSLAFVLARVYYWLNAQLNWPSWPAAAVTVLVIGPFLGTMLWAIFFRLLRDKSQLIQIVATIGLSVALPPVAFLLFGTQAIPQAPGLVSAPSHVFHVFGAAVDLNQVIIYGAVVVVVATGAWVLRRTSAGLRVRALVDSPALTSMSGVNPSGVNVAVWSISVALAGLTGILIAPTNGLTVEAMTTFMASAFAAVVAARLTRLTTAVGVALLIGIATGAAQEYLPSTSGLSAAVLVSIPFAFILVFLAIYVARGGRASDPPRAGVLDRAIRPSTAASTSGGIMASAGYQARNLRLSNAASGIIPLVVIACIPGILTGYWLGLAAEGLAYAVLFLSFTVITGEGGMIWLCQATFAGCGAIGTAQLVTVYHWPLLAAMLVVALGTAIVGVLVGLLTLRLGDLFVSLVTLSFGLLVETLVFNLNIFDQYGAGVTLNRPGFASSVRSFAYLCAVVVIVVGLVIINLRRSTAGLALSATRTSEAGSRTIGLSVVQAKLIATGLGAFVAAIGGTLVAMTYGVAVPSIFDTLGALVWLAVLVTVGIRSITAAVVAGLSLTIFPGVVQTYLPTQWAQLPPLMFGLGAIMVANNPDGVVAMHARQLRGLTERPLARTGPAPVRRADASVSAPAPQPELHR